jgi:murein DD-endopeptidase MepM/ murein hydrolase activator NlpD
LNGQSVKISKTNDPQLVDEFSRQAVLFGDPVQGPYQVSIEVQGAQPVASATVTLQIPEEFRDPAKRITAYYTTLSSGTSGEDEPIIELANADVPGDASSLTFSLPFWAFQRYGSSTTQVVSLYVAKGGVTATPASTEQVAPKSASSCGGPTLTSPLKKQLICTSPYSLHRKLPNSDGTFQVKPHTGLDLRAASGSEVYAMGTGTVVDVLTDVPGCGTQIRIDQSSGPPPLSRLITGYCHLNDQTVYIGQSVTAGQTLIGHSDKTGLRPDSGEHLHIAYIVNGKRIDPEPCLDVSVDPGTCHGFAGTYSGNYSISCADCNGSQGETAYGSMLVTVASDGTFSSISTTIFSSNVNGDQFGSNPGFSGTVASSGVITASSGNNSSGCLHFFASPYTTGQISSSGLMTVDYSQPAGSCPAATGSISANLK